MILKQQLSTQPPLQVFSNHFKQNRLFTNISWRLLMSMHTIKAVTPEHGTRKHETPAEQRNTFGTTNYPQNNRNTMVKQWDNTKKH